jgi:integrase
LGIHKGSQSWCKKVIGRVFYFGKVATDPDGMAALERWLAEKEYLTTGREPPPKVNGALTVRELANRFLAEKEKLRDNGELSPRSWRGYYDTCARIVDTFGKGRAVVDLQPADFGKLRTVLAKTRAAVALRNEIQRVRTVFKWAYDQNEIQTPMRFGQSFAKPKLDIVRREREKHRNAHGDRMFEAEEIRAIIAVSGLPLKTMILLAANCGFGQSDLAALPTRNLDLEKGWVDFARVKTGVSRRVPLWPETVAAIREWLAVRPKAKDHADAGLLFLTVRGARWVKVNERGAPKDAIGQEFVKVLRALKLKRPRVGFYGLRHGFETVAGETADQVAVDAVMGHVPTGMAGAYRERIGDDRVRRVTDHVRQWLFPAEPKAPTPEPGKGSPVSELCVFANRPQEKPVKSKRPARSQTRPRSQTPSANPVPAFANTQNTQTGELLPIGAVDPTARPSLRLFVG